MKVVLYGISNCDTVKKARFWLANQGIEYGFHDFKKMGIHRNTLDAWSKQVSVEAFLNRSSRSWRRLSDAQRRNADGHPEIMLSLMVESPTLIKRPVLVIENRIEYCGFSESSYASILQK